MNVEPRFLHHSLRTAALPASDAIILCLVVRLIISLCRLSRVHLTPGYYVSALFLAVLHLAHGLAALGFDHAQHVSSVPHHYLLCSTLAPGERKPDLGRPMTWSGNEEFVPLYHRRLPIACTNISRHYYYAVISGASVHIHQSKGSMPRDQDCEPQSSEALPP